MSFSAPELNSGYAQMFKPMRYSVSSTEILHEKAMDRFYQVVALKEAEKLKSKKQEQLHSVEYKLPETKIHNVFEEPQLTLETTTAQIHSEPAELKIEEVEEIEETQIVSVKSAESLERESGDIFYEDDYTESTVSTGDSDEDLSEAESFDREVEALHSRIEENTTYHPRDMTATIPISVKPVIEQPARPLPDPNFIPKPILKKRETDQPEPTSPKSPTPSKSIFKKFAKFPKVKNPKMFSRKKTQDKKDEEKSKVTDAEEKEPETIEDNYQDEGRTVIEHYGNLVREYGKAKRPTVLFVNTEDLKNAAPEEKKPVKKIKVRRVVRRVVKKDLNKPNRSQAQAAAESETEATNEGEENPRPPRKGLDKFIEKKTENDQVTVITRNLSRLNAIVSHDVRSGISFVTDCFILGTAIFFYLFRDARWSIVFIALFGYKQILGSMRARSRAWSDYWRNTQT